MSRLGILDDPRMMSSRNTRSSYLSGPLHQHIEFDELVAADAWIGCAPSRILLKKIGDNQVFKRILEIKDIV